MTQDSMCQQTPNTYSTKEGLQVLIKPTSPFWIPEEKLLT